MTVERRQAAKAQLVAMQAGQPWQCAVQAADLTISRSTAYSWRRRFEQEGPAAGEEGNVFRYISIAGDGHGSATDPESGSPGTIVDVRCAPGFWRGVVGEVHAPRGLPRP